FIAGTAAALIWPAVFYPTRDPFTALLLSITTYGLGFVARPIGAIIFGHLGDKLGRRTTLVWTLLTMGIGTLGIGITPSYASIGIWGGILILIFRLIQGLGVGGEWGGATTLLTEYAANSKWKTFWSVWVQEGVPFAFAAANGTFIILLTLMSQKDLYDWGWRIPFYVGTVIIILGVIIRYKLSETPLFKKVFELKQIERVPFVSLMKNQWKTVLLMAGVWIYINSWGYIVPLFMQSYITRVLGLPLTLALISVVATALVNVFVLIGGAYAGDRIGKKNVLLISSTLTIIAAYPYFMLINSRDPTIIILAQIMMFNLSNLGYSVISQLFAEQFPTKYRFSGTAFSYHIGGVLSGGLAPILASYLLTVFKSSAWIYIAAMGIIYCIISIMCIIASKERKELPA
ncbi:MAG: MFS transporter, partial [Sulfolobaceae archaeon]